MDRSHTNNTLLCAQILKEDFIAKVEAKLVCKERLSTENVKWKFTTRWARLSDK